MPELLETSDLLAAMPQSKENHRFGLRRHEALFSNWVSVLDAVVLFGSFVVAYLVRDWLGPGSLQPFRQYLWLGLIVVPIWLTMARATALTFSHTYQWPARAVVLTLKVHLFAGLILLSGLYLLKAVEVSRLLMQTFLVISAAALVVERFAIHSSVVHFAGRWNTQARRLLVIGPQAIAESLHRLLRQRPHWGASVAGVVTDMPSSGARQVRVLGDVTDLQMLFDTHVFDEVVMADMGIAREHGQRIMSECVVRGLSYHTLITMPAVAAGKHHAEVLGDGVYLISLETTPQNPWALLMKRAMDVVGSALGLVVCAIMYVIVGPLIRLESRGPVIFRQVRIGRNGRRFTVYKFRSMRSDAEQIREQLMSANEMRGQLFKLRRDPRVTLVGRILRRAYLDELPQFWNVLKGEMSLVGTRPPTPNEVAEYAPHHRRRLSMRPGITGLWQSYGNGRVSDFETVVRLDCEYIDQWSLLLDVRILVRTLMTVVRLRGQ